LEKEKRWLGGNQVDESCPRCPGFLCEHQAGASRDQARWQCKSKIKAGAPEVGERLKLTQVGTVKDLLRVNLRDTVVSVWHENIRLVSDTSFFMVQKETSRKSKRVKA